MASTRKRKPARRETATEQLDRFEEAIYGSKLPARARLVFLAMLHHATPGPDCFHSDASVTRIGVWTGLSIRSVRREIDALTAASWLTHANELRVPAGGSHA